jgi:hypothetical protein
MMRPETDRDLNDGSDDDDEAPYLDEIWLAELHRFRIPLNLTRPDGSTANIEYQGTGLAGFGSSSIGFYVRDAEGVELVIKMRRSDWSFACYIRELGPAFAFDLSGQDARLQRKLERLIGDAMVDNIVAAYHEINRLLVFNLRNWPPFDQIRWDDEETRRVLNFGVRMPGVMARIERIATRAGANCDRAKWAERTFHLLNATRGASDLQPNLLHENPLYVWGGAILSGFFSRDLSIASERVRELLRARPADLLTLVGQGWALAKLLRHFQIDGAATFADFWQAACNEL